MQLSGSANAQMMQPAGVWQASALLDWWRLSGVDQAVSDAPRGWLAPARFLPEAEPQSPAAVQARQALQPEPAAEDWTRFASWQALVAHVRADWPLCPIIDGNPEAGILVLGEAPSADDLRTGRPFSGPAGQLLDRMLAAIDLDRSRCAIMLLASRRRVPGKPPPDAVARDLPLAQRLIALIAPRSLLMLGQIPTAALTGQNAPIGTLRGQWFRVNEADALATWNPAYLLRSPEAKASAWADLLAFRRGFSA